MFTKLTTSTHSLVYRFHGVRFAHNSSFTSQLSQYNQTPVYPHLINFGIGQPSPSLLPLNIMRRACREQWEDTSIDPLVLQYGTAKGHKDFLEALATFLSLSFGFDVPSEELMVTSGNSHAISMMTQLFAQGKTVVTEDPTYFLAKNIFEELDAKLVGIPTDHHGLNVELLENKLSDPNFRPALLYTIPIYHNPTGVCLSESRKKKLISLAEKYNFYIFSDEPYNLLHYDQNLPLPKSLMYYDNHCGRVVSAGSFSKILAPGLRLGWIHTHNTLLKRLSGNGVIHSGGGLNPFVAYTVQHTLRTSTLSDHLSYLLSTYNSRCNTLTGALTEYLPPGCCFSKPTGGYFLWVRLPEGVSSDEVLGVAETMYEVRFATGPRCSVDGRGYGNFMRLAFSFYDDEELREGAKRLGEAIHVVLEGKKRGK